MQYRSPTRADIGKQVEVSFDEEQTWVTAPLQYILYGVDNDGPTGSVHCRVPVHSPDPVAELLVAADQMADQGLDEAARVLLNAAELLANNEREMKRLAEKYFENGMIPKSLLTPNPEPQP